MDPKILHVTLWPGPPFSGANIHAHNFLKRLTRNHRAKLIVLLPWESTVEATSDQLVREGIVNEGIEVVRFRGPNLWDRLLGIGLSGEVPYVAYFERAIGTTLREGVERIVKEWNPATVVVWFWPVAALLAGVHGIRKVVNQCDSVSLANRNAGREIRNPLRSIYHRLIGERCRQYEQTILPRYDEVVFISQEDARHAALPSSVSVTAICNGVDTAGLKPEMDSQSESSVPVVVFHGALGYGPNAACVRFLVNDLGRRLEARLGPTGFEIRVIGGGASREQVGFAARHSWFKLAGYVPDLAGALCAGTVYVAPVLTGAGVKNKVLDAMACGLPVVGTRAAFSGLDVTNGLHCVICDVSEITTHVLRLAGDVQFRGALGSAAREWVIRNADWDVQAAAFDRVIRRTTGA